LALYCHTGSSKGLRLVWPTWYNHLVVIGFLLPGRIRQRSFSYLLQSHYYYKLINVRPLCWLLCYIYCAVILYQLQ